VEGKQMSSPDLSRKLESVTAECGTLCFIIGSSHGLAPEVKSAAKMRLSVSELTFPHQLMRVILYEAVYRCYQIAKGSKYHK
jgi:23S rRNA (pseudouridine1915-N3)-methyltransferase